MWTQPQARIVGGGAKWIEPLAKSDTLAGETDGDTRWPGRQRRRRQMAEEMETPDGRGDREETPDGRGDRYTRRPWRQRRRHQTAVDTETETETPDSREDRDRDGDTRWPGRLGVSIRFYLVVCACGSG